VVLALAAASVVIGLVLIMPRLPNLAAQAIGFQERGSVETVFQAVTPVPPPALNNVAPAGPVTFSIPDLGSDTLTADDGLAVQTGTDPLGGAPAGQFTLTENDVQALCARYADICQRDPRFRNPRVDLRPGGAIITVDATLPELGGITQPVGVVVRTDGTGRALQVQGIELNGVLYAIPSNDIGTMIRNAEAQLNTALNQLTVDTAAGPMTLDRITFNDGTVTVTLR
jgi:hypothetical protein